MKTSIASAWLIALLSACTVTARTWTSVSGAKLEAEYVGRDGPDIFLKRDNGSQLKIHFDKLSPEDQAHLTALAESTDETDKPAAPSPREENPEQAPLFGSVTYAPVTPLTTDAFPTVPLKQPDTATYWGFQYGPSADEVLYVVFDQPTLNDLHDTAYLYSPNHPKYRRATPLPGKKGKVEEDRVFRFSDIVLQAKHGDVNALYDLEFVYGIERPDILTVFVQAQLGRRGANSKFLTGSHINEQVVFEGPIPVVQALRPIRFTVSSRNRFGKVDASVSLNMGEWQLIPEAGMDKYVLVEMVDAESGRTRERLKIEVEEDVITSTRHGGLRSRLEEPEPGETYDLNGSINLGPIMGLASHSRQLTMPAAKEDD